MGIGSEQRYSLPPMGPELQREESLRLLLALARQGPKPHLIILEDLHWADATTIELIKRMIDEPMPSSTMLLVNYRPEFSATWSAERVSCKIDLDRLQQRDVVALISRVAVDHTISPDVAKAIARASDGIPLFAEELTKTVIKSGDDKALIMTSPGPYKLAAFAHCPAGPIRFR